MRIVALDKESKQSILNDLLKRSPNNYSQYESTVNQIIDRVRAEGDRALFDYTLQFDKFTLTAENIRVTKEEIAEAYTQMDENLIDVIRQSAENIRAFHQKQLRNSWFDAKPDGTILGMKITAIERAGVYVPGGKAAYPSSVLMNVIRMALASSSCSAWDRRSAATYLGVAVSSASTRISLGPVWIPSIRLAEHRPSLPWLSAQRLFREGWS